MPRVSDAYRAKRLDALYRATWGSIARIGIERTTITDIIESSGFSAGMVYNYFASKEDLVDAAHIEAIRRLRGAIESATEKPSPRPDVLFERLIRAIATRPEAGDNAMGALWSMNVSETASPAARAALDEMWRFAADRVAEHALRWERPDGRLVGRAAARADADLFVSVVLGYFAQQRFRTLTSSTPLVDALRSAVTHRAALRRLWSTGR
ncbi:TetR/AcrR family transcriptional regulator [Agromyces protaetiae]|uniref:TetR/AcrR family transcriptional regulator n=1 Tax=Agromyces protaetiae TaxID=2509455 RepID=A0A4V0YGQ4_9MICO|nr:TetR/AcrR family transcriptional regulator [Agromyces protaetiae]QAY72021.1 TetR/AcrR family transcriptional regulator [Agromyces protaetiae]